MSIKSRSNSALLEQVQSEEKIFLASLANGDRASFWKLWICYETDIYRCCLRWLNGNVADADEALSCSVLRAWEQVPAYAENMTNPKAWLMRLTHNVCMDMHRERQRVAVSSEVTEEIAYDYKGIVSEVESPDLKILRKELATLINEAIAALPIALQTPFVLRFHQEKSYAEISEELDISLVNARKRIQQARSHLQKSLHPYMAGLNNKKFTNCQLERHKYRSKKQHFNHC